MRSECCALLAAIILCGCARTRAVTFQGHTSDARVQAEQVIETSVMPRSATWLGRVMARCQPFNSSGSFEDRPLFDLDCSEARLRSLLREGAAEAGGNVISELVCNSGSSRECRALVSTLPHARGSAPLAPELRAVVGNARVAFLREVPGVRSEPRPSELVIDRTGRPRGLDP